MRKRIVGVTLAATAIILGFPQIQTEEPNQKINIKSDAGSFTRQEPITLVRTIDGDTIKVKIKGKTETIRYLLVDTPESKKEGMCVQPFAKDAFQRNNQLVKSGRLTLEFEEGNTRDSYGRLLAYVYVDGKMVQETLVKEGFARVAFIMNPPYKFLNLLRENENLAKRNKVNIWSHPNFVTKWGFNGCVQRQINP
ncbi:thermonuclease family protein [Paenibacillus sp. BSR1-1]|uniref:thermonuclease family protein n=1 Tax=Paenibacillus sp. BSR1-1 TaxID=3020845 RepID=UPI0025AFBB85|nr:thermonuclease family protein [Paenibacillus sp. BSR1-1]MDN3015773.1 thermonuclease family protein [Paenibacillus sp. BSR1-1]